MKKYALGIDEAGRGPVIGSMFIAGVILSPEKSTELFDDGARDSKKLSKKRREELYPVVKDKAFSTYSVETKAAEIDFERQRISLNELEAQKMAKVIEKALEEDLNLEKIIIDLPDPNADKFMNRINKYIDIPDEIEVIAEHGADDKYSVCSAASIIAKVDRDRHVADLSEKYGLDIVTGYPHEKSVNEYLKKIIDNEEEYPDFVRTSWRTAERVKENKEQSKIGDY